MCLILPLFQVKIQNEFDVGYKSNIVDLFMMDNIGILSFKTFHKKFKVILNLKNLNKFQLTYTNMWSNQKVWFQKIWKKKNRQIWSFYEGEIPITNLKFR
jgi:hypothetical protein